MEEHLFLKTTFLGRNVLGCHAELHEALGDHAVTEVGYRHSEMEECQQLTRTAVQCEVTHMTLMVFAALPIIGSKPLTTLGTTLKVVKVCKSRVYFVFFPYSLCMPQ